MEHPTSTTGHYIPLPEISQIINKYYPDSKKASPNLAENFKLMQIEMIEFYFPIMNPLTKYLASKTIRYINKQLANPNNRHIYATCNSK